MVNYSDRRKYQRTDNVVCRALVNTDGIHWTRADPCDISAGGLKFITEHDFCCNDPIQIDLDVYNMLSEFNIRLTGTILREEFVGCCRAYAVRFDGVNKYMEVQLDELVRMGVRKSDHEPVFKEERFMLHTIPRFGERTSRSRLTNIR